MIRWSFLALAVAASGCNNPTCGPGTKQVQQKDGTVQCVQADAQPDAIPCDVDAGATIVGGHCVSAISCGPNTMLVNGQCIGTGMGGGVPQCPAPPAGTFCINGALVNFQDNSTAMDNVDVSVWDATVLVSGGAPIDHNTFSGGGYVLNGLTPPPLGLIAVVVSDPDGNRMNTTYINCAVGDQGIAAGQKYRADAYVLKKSVADSITGFDYATGGQYVAKYYSDARPVQTDLEVANDKNPVMGVQLVENGGANPAGTKYFNATMTAFDGALTATGASGAATVAAPVAGSFPTFSGMGGGIMWETQPGGSKAGLVFVTRFHKM